MNGKKRFPRSITVFGGKVKIRVRHPVRDSHGEKCQGTYCYETKTIEIDSKLSDEAKINTLIHELIHAIFDRLSIDSNVSGISREFEESIVHSTANTLTELFNIEFKTKPVLDKPDNP